MHLRKNLLRFFEVEDGVSAVCVGDVDDVNVTLHSVDIRTHVEFVREIQGEEFVGFSFEHNCFFTDSYAINCGDDLAIVGQFDHQRLRLIAQTVHEIEGEDRHHLTDLGMANDLDDGALLII